MELIPIIYIKNRRIFLEKDGGQILIKEILKHNEKYSKIYIFDLDGIEKNKPNLCTYQRLISNYEIWIDAGPRVIGDIVDFVMTGATDITIRKNIFPLKNIPTIREMTESRIYTDLDIQNEIKKSLLYSDPDINGFVLFKKDKQIKNDFKISAHLTTLCKKNIVYVFEPHGKNINYWKNIGATGLLIDLKFIKQVQNQ
jgi:hypothetical protein